MQAASKKAAKAAAEPQMVVGARVFVPKLGGACEVLSLTDTHVSVRLGMMTAELSRKDVQLLGLRD